MVDDTAHLRELMDERDKRYQVQFQAGESAAKLAIEAQDKQTDAAFKASQRAIDKAEQAQREYNQTHNDLLRKMELLIPRQELESIIRPMQSQIDDVRAAQNQGTGKETATKWMIGLGPVLVAAIIGVVSFFMARK